MATVGEAKPASGPERGSQVRSIFSQIAPRYDLLNHVLSLNIDRGWRRRAVDELGWGRVPEGRYLDACAGTFDLSLELARRDDFRGTVVASDFARPMLVQGRDKLGRAPVSPLCADSLQLPFPDGSFDGAMVGFGVRNLADLERGLAELRRVLQPGARAVILDFTLPPKQPVRGLYLFYFTRVLPLLGGLISGHPHAYRYLPESVKEFPGPDRLERMLLDAGFQSARHSLLTFGIAALHVAVR